jgi:UDP-GlcNAc:undecaprenyl-phosphate/decaprenyl-phosphate GlcNAc-1-phosphate transferase
MYSLLFLFIVSVSLSFAFTPAVRNLSLRLGLVDQPGGRKMHAEPIPRVGGVAIALAYLSTFGLLLLSQLNGGLFVHKYMPMALRLLPAAGLILGVGLLDDIVRLRPWQKLAGQILGVLWAYYSGIRITMIAGYDFGPTVAMVLTLLWLLGCTNAFNLIDGVDGLAAGVGFLSTATIFIAALLHGQVDLAIATIPLAGCLVGFLWFNFNPASIFLGDSGSLLIGFLLGCYSITWSQKCATVLAMTAPLMALAVPLLDVGLSIARRFLRRQPIFGADRGHIHHRLLDRGLTPRRAVLLIYGGCGLAATFSLLQSVVRNRYAGVIVILFCAAAWYAIQNLGYAEFGVARDLLIGSRFRRMLNAQLRLQNFEARISGAAGVEDCWQAIRETAADFGFISARAHLDGRTFMSQLAPAPSSAWQMRIAIGGANYVNLEREVGSEALPAIVVPFADKISSTVEAKLQELRSGRATTAERYYVAGSASGSLSSFASDLNS